MQPYPQSSDIDENRMLYIDRFHNWNFKFFIKLSCRKNIGAPSTLFDRDWCGRSKEPILECPFWTIRSSYSRPCLAKRHCPMQAGFCSLDTLCRYPSILSTLTYQDAPMQVMTRIPSFQQKLSAVREDQVWQFWNTAGDVHACDAMARPSPFQECNLHAASGLYQPSRSSSSQRVGSEP